MSDFAKEKNLRLLTHSDPEVMLASSTLESEVCAGLSPDYAVRYQIMDSERGVLKDKRYIVRLNKAG